MARVSITDFDHFFIVARVVTIQIRNYKGEPYEQKAIFRRGEEPIP